MSWLDVIKVLAMTAGIVTILLVGLLLWAAISIGIDDYRKGRR